MTIRCVATDFGYKPPTSITTEVISSSIVGPAGSYLAPNTIDSGPYGAALTELTALDTILTVGGQNFFVEQGVGRDMKLVVDWITAPQGGVAIQTQLITSSNPDMAAFPFVTMIDFGVLPIATFVPGYRQIQSLPRSNAWGRYLALRVITTGAAAMTAGAYVAWLGLDVDSEILGYASGFPIK